MPYKNITITTEDGVPLNAWLIEPTTRGSRAQKTVIVFHPYNSHKSNLLAIAQALWDANYNVLLPDFRSFSTNQRQSLGYLEQRDALAAVNWVVQNVPSEKGIALMGASMGGSVVGVIAHQVQDVANLQGLILDCPFSSLEDVVSANIENFGHLPAVFVPWATLVSRTFNKLWYGYDFDEVSPKDAIKKVHPDVNLLSVHSTSDIVCPVSQDEPYLII
eukprot:UN26315